MLSFQNPEHKQMLGFLGRLVGYYRQQATKKFLAYGQLMRPLGFREPSPMPMLAYKGGGKFPALMSGVFRSDDGALGIFVVNASIRDLGFQADLDPARYKMPAKTVVDVDTFAPNGSFRQVLSKVDGVIALTGSLPAYHVTMFRLRSTAHP